MPEIISQLLYNPVFNIDIGGTGVCKCMTGMLTITSDTLVSEAIVVVAKVLPSTVVKPEKALISTRFIHKLILFHENVKK